VPDEWIATLVAAGQVQTGGSVISCFVSYSAQDQEFAQKLAARLREAHFRVWEATENLPGGKTPEAVEPALKHFDKWIVVVSKHSLKGEWLATEVRQARQAESRRPCQLVPVRLIDSEMLKKWLASDAGKDAASELTGLAVSDFSNGTDPRGFESALARLVKELRTPTQRKS
jgi:hypothetical protein